MTAGALGADVPTLRGRLLAAARQMVGEAGGLSISLDDVTLEKVIKRAAVSRTSAYRVWPNREAFAVDLLCDLVATDSFEAGASGFDVVPAVRTLLADRLGELGDEAGRRAVLRAAARLGAGLNYERMHRSIGWRNQVVLAAALVSMRDPDGRARVADAIEDGESAWAATMGRFYEDVCVLLGLRPRPGVSFEQVAAAGAAVLEGVCLRQLLSPGQVERPVPGAGEGAEGMPLAEYLFTVVIESLVELDPKYEPSTAIADYARRLGDRGFR